MVALHTNCPLRACPALPPRRCQLVETGIGAALTGLEAAPEGAQGYFQCPYGRTVSSEKGYRQVEGNYGHPHLGQPGLTYWAPHFHEE